jgi:membrane protease YdiL (CAAX protease family)
MPSNPFESLAYLVLGGAVLVLWVRQLRRAELEGDAFWPGARPFGWPALAWAAAGALVLTLLETGLEIQLGVAQLQSTIPAHFLMAMLGAAVVEEMAFRGFTASAALSGARLIATALAGSAVFMLLHGHVAGIKDGELWFDGSDKALVSAGSSFAISLWLYACRFSPLNPSRSLAPAMVGHAVRNLAVFGIKDAQGFVSWG